MQVSEMDLCAGAMSYTLTVSQALASTAKAATRVHTVRTVPSPRLTHRQVSSCDYYRLSFRDKCSRDSHCLVGRKSWSSSASMRHSISIQGMANDSSNVSPLSDDNDVQPKDYTSAKGGIRLWLQKFITQKEELTNNLKRYGVAGVLSYGLLNTFYYLVAFLFVWFYVAPSEGGLGFAPAAQRFVKVFAMVWAGSQVTKLIRAAGALTLAPFVDRGLNWYTNRFNFHSRGKAFAFIVVACVLLAISVFLIVTILWA